MNEISFELMVNHFIHRDYTVMAGEVHLDIYDDRITVTSPGGIYIARPPSLTARVSTANLCVSGGEDGC